jgi:hypothetical protein
VWSTIPPIWRKRTITSHLIIVLNTKKKPTTYDVGNSDLGLENAKIWRGSTGKWEKIQHNIKMFTYNV